MIVLKTRVQEKWHFWFYRIYELMKAIGIGLSITEEPSHSTVHTDRVYGGSAGKDKIGCEKSHRFYRVFRIRMLLAFQLLLQYANK